MMQSGEVVKRRVLLLLLLELIEWQVRCFDALRTCAGITQTIHKGCLYYTTTTIPTGHFIISFTNPNARYYGIIINDIWTKRCTNKPLHLFIYERLFFCFLEKGRFDLFTDILFFFCLFCLFSKHAHTDLQSYRKHTTGASIKIIYYTISQRWDKITNIILYEYNAYL